MGPHAAGMDPGRAGAHDAAPAAPAGPPPAAPAETLHRVANSLAILSAALRMEQRQVGDPTARTALGDAVARIEAMAQVHRLIYGLPPEAHIDLTAFLGQLAPVIGRSLGMGCGVRGTAVEVTGRTAEGLAVAVTELALNAYKHGYGGAPGRGVEVRVSPAPGGWVRLAVRDWGRGLAEAPSPFSGADGANADGAGVGGAGMDGAGLDGAGAALSGRAAGRARTASGDGSPPRSLRGGLGLRLVASAVETLGGRMTTVTDGGVHVVVEVPQG